MGDPLTLLRPRQPVSRLASGAHQQFSAIRPGTIFREGAMLPKLAIWRKLAILVAFLAAGPTLAASPSASHRTSTAPATSLASNQFTSEQAAKSHCPGDTIVWANTGGSKAYHLSGNRYFGKTKHGAYMCRKDADSSGLHVAGSRRGTKKSASKTPSSGAAPATSK